MSDILRKQKKIQDDRPTLLLRLFVRFLKEYSVNSPHLANNASIYNLVSSRSILNGDFNGMVKVRQTINEAIQIPLNLPITALICMTECNCIYLVDEWINFLIMALRYDLEKIFNTLPLDVRNALLPRKKRHWWNPFEKKESVNFIDYIASKDFSRNAMDFNTPSVHWSPTLIFLFQLDWLFVFQKQRFLLPHMRKFDEGVMALLASKK